MLLEISELVVFNERSIFIDLEKDKRLAEETLLSIEVNYLFSIMSNKGDFEFDALLHTPYYAETDDPDEMYSIYFGIFTREKELVMLK
jgi:hypothetical protein